VAPGGPTLAAAPNSANSSAVASLSSSVAGGAGDGGVGRTPSERLLDKTYARELLHMK